MVEQVLFTRSPASKGMDTVADSRVVYRRYRSERNEIPKAIRTPRKNNRTGNVFLRKSSNIDLTPRLGTVPPDSLNHD
jgi:hypothetical protein